MIGKLCLQMGFRTVASVQVLGGPDISAHLASDSLSFPVQGCGDVYLLHILQV